MTRTEELIFDLDSIHVSMGEQWLRRLKGFSELDRRGVWEKDGCVDMAQWIAGRYKLSSYRADRYVKAGHVVAKLPLISAALCDGTLEVDQVVELCRFATPQTEEDLIRWARRVTTGQIRWRAEKETKPSIEETQSVDRSRSLSYWWEEDGKVLGLSGRLPSAEGASVVKAIDRIADKLAYSPEDYGCIDERRADALVLLAQQRLADDGDKDRATVVIHADLESLMMGDQHFEIEGGGVIPPATLDRYLCDCRLGSVLCKDRHPVGIDRISRNVPPWLMKLLTLRDKCCTFPGCHHRRFVDAHHIDWWSEGGPTDIENLLLVCRFHHKLVHEYHWRVELGDIPGTADWYRPDGSLYDPGPDPPEPPREWFEPQPELELASF